MIIGKQEIASQVKMRLTKASLAKYSLPAGKAEALIFDQDLPASACVRVGVKRTWIAQYRLGTKQRRITLGTTETLEPDEARRRAKEALAKVSLGADPQTEKRAAKEQASVTMSAVVPRYLAYASRRQTPAYHADAKRYLTRHWAPLSEMALKQIERSTIAVRLADIAKENGPHAANRARATLSAFYAWAMGDGVAAANPVIGTHKATEEVRRDRGLTDAELAQALAPGRASGLWLDCPSADLDGCPQGRGRRHFMVGDPGRYLAA